MTEATTQTTAQTKTGPIHVAGELLAVKRVGAYRHVTLVAPGIPERFRPGNFVAVSVAEAHLGRRAFWIHRARPTGGYGATIELVVADTGYGSHWLCSQPPGSRIELTGPLGRPFALPKEPVSCLLVGDGYAAATLFPLAERLRERQCVVNLLLGAADEAHLLSALEARRTARSVTVVTADGSVGQSGAIGDVVVDVLKRNAVDVVYAAGPVPMLHRVAAAAEEHGAWSQTALETPMACATGLCQGCPVPVLGEDGVARHVRACADGPVFRGDRVRWAELESP
jgi:dihydroorotate dehydrogenase electron transfer subunit